jgi:phosphonopyruvate decarboxylase
MINGKDLLSLFKQKGFNYYTGIPDSTFQGFINELYKDKEITHRLSINECESTFLAGAYNISTGNIGVVYMQNAGLGKAVNPLTSYASFNVYQTPILFLIGWRGEPGEKDEPQHHHMGCITPRLLELLQVPYELLPDNLQDAGKVLDNALNYMRTNSAPYAILIKKGRIDGKKIPADDINAFANGQRQNQIVREEVIKAIINLSEPEDIIISTTGKSSRELFEYRETNKQGHGKDFLNVGGMGGAAAQALEIAIQHPNRRVYCIDGDGAALMQLGTMTTIGHYHPKNFVHIIIDNNSYQSTGNQKSISNTMHFGALAITCGYKKGHSAYSFKDFYERLEEFKKLEGPIIIIVHCNKQCRSNLGRPTTTPLQNKDAFMKNLGVKNGTGS